MARTAQENLESLRGNPYPGRGICIGLDHGRKHVYQAYWIMGRSANSRSRVFLAQGGTLRTAPADPSLVKDPALVIYNAMRELPSVYIVSNGDQTDTIYDGMGAGRTFAQSLERRIYEPDGPNFTPRISGVCDLKSAVHIAELCVIRKAPWSDAAQRAVFQYEALPQGEGFTVTTYMGDGNPLPSFEGEPYLLPLDGPPQQAAQTLWDALDKGNRVSLALKSVELATGKSEISVINAYRQVR